MFHKQPPRRRRRSPRERGAALAVVLWITAILTILATTMAALSVSQARLAQRAQQDAQLKATLDSALTIRLLQLTASDAQSASPILATDSIRIGSETLDVSVESEEGRLDLNAASESLVRAYFQANGWDESDAREMAARIVQWRSGTGRESAAGTIENIRMGPLQSVSELLEIPGASEISPALLQGLTVYTHAPVPYYSGAPEPVRVALTWAQAQRLDGHDWLDSSDQRSSASLAVGTSAGRLLRVKACSFGQLCREALIRVTGRSQSPIEVFEWH